MIDDRLLRSIEAHAPKLLDAGQRALAKLGPGALFTRPGLAIAAVEADVVYLPEAVLREDGDPALGLVETLVEGEAALIVAWRGAILTYRLTRTGVYLWRYHA